MAGGQQEILGRHIYECDIQNINGIIIPTDMIQRENLQVFVKNGNTEIASGYTDENGVFDISYFLSSASSPYDLVTKCGNVTSPTDTSGNTLSVLACSLTLLSNKDAISYKSGESATISATLKGTYTNEVLPNREITFEIKKNNNIISRETVKTNSSGIAKITYNSKGLGDISVTAYIGMLSNEIYIEDCIVFDDCTTNSIENIFNVPSNVKSSSTYSFSSNGWKYGNVSSYTMFDMNNVSLTFPFEISLKLNGYNRNGLGLFIGPNNEIYFATDSSNRLYLHDTTDHFFTYNQGHAYKLKCYSDKTEVYDENSLIYTTTQQYTPSRIQLGTGANRWVEIKDFKIKTLTEPLTEINLSTTKDILSHAHSDTCTLTATLTGENISGRTIEFFNGSTSLGTSVTNSNGVATFTYESQGIGDVLLTASIGNSSAEIYIEDCAWYDDASIDKSSSYTKYNSPIFNYADGKYYIRKTSSGWGFVTPMTAPITTNEDISIEVKFEYVGMFLGIGLYKSTSIQLPLTYYTPSKAGMYGYGSTNSWIIAQEDINTSAPLTVKFDLKDNVINLSVYDNNGILVWSKSNITIPSVFNNSNLYLTIGNPDHPNSNNYSYFKNVKIKPL